MSCGKQERISLSKRHFLKKAAYSAPVLVSLGTLLKPEHVFADHSGGPPGPPGGFLSAPATSQNSKKVKKRLNI